MPTETAASAERPLLRGPHLVGGARASQDAWGDRLHDAVPDDPCGQEATHALVRPAQLVGQEHREGHHEPDVPRAEEEEACRRQPVDRRPTWTAPSASGGFFFDLPMSSSRTTSSIDHGGDQRDDHRPQGAVVVDPRQQGRAEEEADALQRVLRAGEDGHHPEQRAVAGHGLHGALGAHLGEVLGHARQRLHGHHERHRQPPLPRRAFEGERGQRHDLQPQAGHERAVQAAPGTDPAAEQVREDAHELVGEEQEGDGHRRVAELVEVQQHQHAQRAVGEGEHPVARRHQDVVAELHDAGSSEAATLAASSAMRCT